eukprot:g943.t1
MYQAIRALGKIGGFPSDAELLTTVGDPKTVKSVDKATFKSIMTQRVQKFKNAGGVEKYFTAKTNFGVNPFDCLDEKKRGTLDYAETRNILTAMGDKISAAEFDQLLEECGFEKGKPINHERLYAVMKKKILE